MIFENKYTDSEKKKNGIFYTPQDVSELMSNKTKIFDDGEGIWLDPCCGLGILSINLASIQEDPFDFIKNRLIINEKDKSQLEIALNNFREKFGVVPRSFNEDFLEYNFQCDYIIMNPPYFKYKDSDIYGYFLDKASKITRGFISINPISFTNGKKFKKTRENILKFNSITLYHFDNIPGHIFDDAAVRVSIIVAHNISKDRKTTGQIRWQSKRRKEMLGNLDSNLSDGILTSEIFYKTIPGTKNLIHDNKLSNYVVSKSNFPIYITNSPRYFITASSKKLDRNGQIEIFMKDEDSYNKALIMLNSSYLYWWWRTCDSSMSLTKTTLLSLPWVNFDYDHSFIEKIKISELNNKVYKKNAGKLQENIKHPKDLVMYLNSLFIPENLIRLHD
ncbi:MAG: N-6 DNA methylase [Nanoarchaeota archaeon]